MVMTGCQYVTANISEKTWFYDFMLASFSVGLYCSAIVSLPANSSEKSWLCGHFLQCTVFALRGIYRKILCNLTPLATQNATCVTPMCDTKNTSCLTKTLNIMTDGNGLTRNSSRDENTRTWRECYLFTYLRLSIDIHGTETASGSVLIYG